MLWVFINVFSSLLLLLVMMMMLGEQTAMSINPKEVAEIFKTFLIYAAWQRDVCAVLSLSLSIYPERSAHTQHKQYYLWINSVSHHSFIHSSSCDPATLWLPHQLTTFTLFVCVCVCVCGHNFFRYAIHKCYSLACVTFGLFSQCVGRALFRLLLPNYICVNNTCQ